MRTFPSGAKSSNRSAAMVEAWLASDEAHRAAAQLLTRNGVRIHPDELLADAWTHVTDHLETEQAVGVSVRNRRAAERVGLQLLDQRCQAWQRLSVLERFREAVVDQHGLEGNLVLASEDVAAVTVELVQMVLTERGYPLPGTAIASLNTR